MAFPGCAAGLDCTETCEVSIPGACNTCVKIVDEELPLDNVEEGTDGAQNDGNTTTTTEEATESEDNQATEDENTNNQEVEDNQEELPGDSTETSETEETED